MAPYSILALDFGKRYAECVEFELKNGIALMVGKSLITEFT